MIDVLNLSLPYFGLIFVGFACGKFRKLPETGLAWLNFFLLYVALPALFFRILAKTPFEQLNNLPFVIATTCATALAFMLAAALGFVIRRGRAREAVMAGLAGGYGNIGYMGPGLALATFGPSAAVPVALIFCFDSVFLFSIVPLLMALFQTARRPLLPTIANVARQIVFHPLIVASWLGALAAAFHFEPPVALDRTLAVPAERRRACCAVCARRDRGAAPVRSRAMGGARRRRHQAAGSPVAGFCDAVRVRTVRRRMDRHRLADGIAAAGAQRLHHRPAIRHHGWSRLRPRCCSARWSRC